MGRWLETFAQPYTAVLAADDKPRFLAEVIEELRDPLCDETGNWRADYVRLRFSAAKPGAAMPISSRTEGRFSGSRYMVVLPLL